MTPRSRALGAAASAVVALGALALPVTSTAAAPDAAAEAARATPPQRPAATSGARGPAARDAAADAARALARHAGAARGSVAADLQPTDVVLDRDGGTHVRFEREVGGLPVRGGDLVVHRAPGGAWEGVSQTLAAAVPDRLAASRPQVSAARAVRIATAPARAVADVRGRRVAGEPVLVVDARGARPRLAWEVTTGGRRTDGTPSRLTTTVDARSGAVLDRVEGVHTADGEGITLYSGTVRLSMAPSGSGFALTDVAHGNGRTTDMNNKQDGTLCQLLGNCTVGTAFTSPDASFGSGTTASRESAAADAHLGAATTYDYFASLGRTGIFGDGRGVVSRVHYGRNYVNAFWDGAKMTYGDGDGKSYGPLVSLDVAGHEMSHGITENTANLTYSGESGGLNEATSDIFGTMVEFFAATPADPGDYYIGEEFDRAAGTGFRRMDDPARDGSSYSCYVSGIGNADVHYSSGVGNHFFYLLAEGSGTRTIGGRVHSSPTCDGSTVAGSGRDAAQRIWFRALTVYMTSGTTYAQARTATLAAARDLYGAGSTQQTTVAAAWSAVGLG
ncbi:M4 family metallopeptidase [Nocardioides sp.]|uniref:M4 family metallopeptidase n=1 Tax=Nocardioides sp. TaxID=35761 RepID=UPI0035170C80